MVEHGEANRGVETLVRERHHRGILAQNADVARQAPTQLLRIRAVDLDAGEARYTPIQQIG